MTGGRWAGASRPARRRRADKPAEPAEPLIGQAGEDRARAIALRRLTRSPQSRAELERAIEQRGVAAEPAATVLDGLERVGLVDDAEYAAMIVRTRHAERGLARPAIALELRRRGIDREVASTALTQVDDEMELSRALQLAQRHLAKNRRLAAEVRTRRAFGHLARKGYSMSVAQRAVRQADAALAADDADVA